MKRKNMAGVVAIVVVASAVILSGCIKSSEDKKAINFAYDQLEDEINIIKIDVYKTSGGADHVLIIKTYDDMGLVYIERAKRNIKTVLDVYEELEKSGWEGDGFCIQTYKFPYSRTATVEKMFPCPWWLIDKHLRGEISDEELIDWVLENAYK